MYYLLSFLLLLSQLQANQAHIPLKVIFGDPEKTSPTLSPDGFKVAYLAPHNNVLNVWVKNIEKNNDRVVTHETHRGIRTYSWTYLKDHLVYMQDNNGDENFHLYLVNSETGQITDLTPFEKVKAEILAMNKKFPAEILILLNKENPRLFDVYKLNIVTGELEMIEKNPGSIITWLADNNLVVRAALANNADASQTLFIKGTDKEWHKALDIPFEDALQNELYCGLLQFSKDGNHLFLNSSLNNKTRSLLSLDLSTNTYQILQSDDTYDCQKIVFNSKSGKPEIGFWQKERLYSYALHGEIKKDLANIKSLSSGDLFYVNKNSDGTKWIVGFLYDTKSSDYYLYDRATSQTTFLFSEQTELDSYQLAPTQAFTVVSRDGLSLHGYLTYPLDKDRRNLPVVLRVHGGPFSQDKWGLTSEVQWLANRGYLCVQVNFRGSTGYGKKFLAAGNGEWGGKMHDDLVDTAQWLIEKGIADPKRIAIYGGSYGGYAALVGASFTPNLFCCAIDVVGPSSLVTNIESIPSYWARSPWEIRMGVNNGIEFLKSRSPLFKVDNITIPLMIAHGAQDVRVPQSESEQIILAMKNKGIPYKYLLFEDEGHGFKRPENRMIFYDAVEKFLLKNLS